MEELYKTFNFPSLSKFVKILKRNNLNYKYADVKDFIEKQSINQIHKPVFVKKEKQRFFFALKPYEIIQIDLLDYQKYSKTNKNNKYILIAVDVFSRKAFAIPIKDKKPSSVLEGFLSFKIKPNVIFHDDGKEYLNVFLNYINNEDLINVTIETGDHNSLGIINRFSRTIKSNIEKYLNYNNTTKYYDILPKLIDNYNNSPHNSLGDLSPNDVFENDKNYKLVQKINLAKIAYNNELDKKKQKFNIGDKVRVQIKKKIFTKGYKITYSKEIFSIREIEGNHALLDNGEKIKLKYLQIINDGENINTSNIDNAENNEAVKRKLRKEGIYEDR